MAIMGMHIIKRMAGHYYDKLIYDDFTKKTTEMNVFASTVSRKNGENRIYFSIYTQCMLMVAYF